MSRRMVAVVLAAALVSSCGDQIDQARTCMELQTAARQAIGEAAADAAPSEVLGEIHDRVAERARELGGEALARGADTEAALCASLAD